MFDVEIGFIIWYLIIKIDRHVNNLINCSRKNANTGKMK